MSRPADRATRLRRDFERRFGRSLLFVDDEVLGFIENRAREEIAEHEVDVRAEYAGEN
jgi:hypothetical protein